MPAKETKSGNKKPAAKKKPEEDEDKAKVSMADGSVHADCPIPPQVQQWLNE